MFKCANSTRREWGQGQGEGGTGKSLPLALTFASLSPSRSLIGQLLPIVNEFPYARSPTVNHERSASLSARLLSSASSSGLNLDLDLDFNLESHLDIQIRRPRVSSSSSASKKKLHSSLFFFPPALSTWLYSPIYSFSQNSNLSHLFFIAFKWPCLS